MMAGNSVFQNSRRTLAEKLFAANLFAENYSEFRVSRLAELERRPDVTGRFSRAREHRLRESPDNHLLHIMCILLDVIGAVLFLGDRGNRS